MKHLDSVNEVDDYQFGLKKVFQLIHVHMFLSRLFSIIDREVFMYFVVLLILARHSIM